jgi:hypothetical protein
MRKLKAHGSGCSNKYDHKSPTQPATVISQSHGGAKAQRHIGDDIANKIAELWAVCPGLRRRALYPAPNT